MSRNTRTYTVPALEGNRDSGKQFFLTEMPAMQAHKWATRALLALAKTELKVPEEIMDMGLAGIMAIGLKALGGMSHRDAQELLDELLTCVQVQPDPNKPEIIRKLHPVDVDEWTTIYKLQMEVIDLHTGFFSRAKTLRSQVAAMAKKMGESGPSTGTSRESLAG